MLDTETKNDVEGGTVLATGRIISIAHSPELINNIGKAPQSSAQITKWGIPGDHHYGATRVNSRGQVIENRRPITVVGVEGEREACEKLGVPMIPAGGLGENLLFEGMGDLSEAQPGDRICILDETGKSKVVLENWQQNEPCSNLMIYHKQMVKEMYGKRGLLCTVLQEGHVELGDRAILVRPS